MSERSPVPGYLTPEGLHTAYALPSETPSSSLQTIAVVDAYDDPKAEADLGVYDTQFGLPACTAANGCFRKINQEGRAGPLPPRDGGWAVEISLDVQMAHAICRSCRVLLVEANSEQVTDLGTAVNAAVAAGATEISNSYAGAEEAPDSAYNSDYYDHPGVVLTVASGDCGYLNEACLLGEAGSANFPADSPDVVAVGGTTLTSAGETWSSTVWEDGGSGCSRLFTAPLWQSDVVNFSATACGSGRSIADVAAIGDPNTGVDVYDSTPSGEGYPTGWGVWGGTSVASPIVAGEFALAGGSHAVPYPAATLYSHLGESDALYDVRSGKNGFCAGATSCQAAIGYDGPSGVGSPIGLGAFSTLGSPVSISRPTVSGIAEQGQTLTLTPGEWANSPASIGDQWEDCNPSGSGCSAIAGATGQTYALAASDVGSTIRVQEIASNAAGGSGAPTDSTQTATVVSNVPSLSGFTPSSAITGGSVTINGSGLGGASGVYFGASAANFSVLSPTQIEATVPNGARAGKISVSTPLGTLTSSDKFRPTLSLTAFAPKSGVVGKLVTIKGVGFNSSSSVSFDGVAASGVTHVSSTKLKATAPLGAGTGPITVTNTLAPVGTVAAAGSFSLT
ncbi:MAG: IPT/TIG domain-containing protein [Solirubrobacteraceae bacterium]